MKLNNSESIPANTSRNLEVIGNPHLTALDTRFDGLAELWKSEEGMTDKEVHWHLNAFIGALSVYVPEDIWKRAIATANKATLHERKMRERMGSEHNGLRDS